MCIYSYFKDLSKHLQTAPKKNKKKRPANAGRFSLYCNIIGYTRPWSSIASATLMKPPMLAPFT